MIVRTYGRRRGLTRSYSETSSFSDGASESPSQECPEDVYNFTFSSQDSARCHWSDPYGFGSSQESRQLTNLPPRKGGDDGGFWKPKKLKVIDIDSEPYGSTSSQELRDFSVLEISEGDFKKSKKAKKDSFDPYEYNSSQDLDDFGVLPPRKAEKTCVFEFSENDDVWKSSKPMNVDSDSFGLNSAQELGGFGISQSRKCQVNRDSWDFDGVSGKSKKKDQREKNKSKKKIKTKDTGAGDIVVTNTLMETQEFGEMMEHVDEVNFALDGLKRGEQVKIRRGSLLSLLSICGTAQQRRLLRVHGMSKTIMDAVVGLNLDDPPSNLAAASLFYILTSDGQDDHLLDSPSCIRFLIKLLKPIATSPPKENAPTIGSKLLGVSRSVGFLQDSAKGTDSGSTAITHKVHDILVNCKEMKPRNGSDNGIEQPKLSPKWISLLAMEKACMSTISIEDTTGTVRKNGGHFKEKLRHLGGLDAVFEVSRTCHSVMEDWLEKSPSFDLDSRETLGLESLVLLLKCLKIMENATFLSNDNQCHLLGMKGKFDGQRAPRSFTKLILSVIKILSGVSLVRSSLVASRQDEKADGTSSGNSYSGGYCGMEVTASQKGFGASQCPLSCQLGSSNSGLEPSSMYADPLLLKMRMESSTAGSCSGTSSSSRISNTIINISSNDLELEFGSLKTEVARKTPETMVDSQDPFAFDEDEFEPSKWDILSGTVKKPASQAGKATLSQYKDGNHSLMLLSQQESSNIENHQSLAASCSFSASVDQEKSSLLADCLLTSVKVLMNLTNDNPEGCQQIATCGGLEVLSSLIGGHFPSLSSSLLHFTDVREQQSSIQLTDQELDFLVAILGLLVNLVEKDGRNRSRLAAASVSLPSMEGTDNERDVIPVLCSIFLANQGAGEAAGEGKYLSWEDDESILQGEKEAEKMIVEAYAALLLAFLSTESKSIRNSIADCLPNHNLAILVPVLERFVEFHMTLNMISPETHSTVLEVIESCRNP